MTHSEITSAVVLTIVSRMRNARVTARSFDAMGAGFEDSAEMWRTTYEHLEAVLIDQIKTANDEWAQLVNALRGEWSYQNGIH